ncbi:MAG TPA: hypothetical protein VIM29_05325 [Bacillota bacterium]
MENEKFQDLVLNHLAKLTQDLTEFKLEMTEFKEEMSSFKRETINKRFEQIDSRLDRLEQKQDNANQQLSQLLEFKTEATQKLDKLLDDDVDFLKYKEFQNEADIFKLKNQLKVIK